MKLIGKIKLWMLVILSLTHFSKAEIYEKVEVLDRAGNCYKVDYKWVGTFTQRPYNGWICPQTSSVDEELKNEFHAIKAFMQDPSNHSFFVEEKKDQIAVYKGNTSNLYKKSCADEYAALYEAGLLKATGFFRDHYCDSIDNVYSFKCLKKVASYRFSKVFADFDASKLDVLAACKYIDNSERFDTFARLMRVHKDRLDKDPANQSNDLYFLGDDLISESRWVYPAERNCVFKISSQKTTFFGLEENISICRELTLPNERKCLYQLLEKRPWSDIGDMLSCKS